MKKFNLKDLYGIQIGGTVDTLALTALGLSGVLTAPIGGSIPLLPLQLSLAAMGSGWLGMRTLEGWSKMHLLDTPLNVRSARSPANRRKGKVSGLLLGYATDTGEEIFISDEDLTRHLFVLGQSGVGKTVFGSLFLFQQIQRGGGLLFIDGKCNIEDLHTMYHLCAWCGRERDLLVINPGDPDMTNTYSPILYGDPSEIASRILSLIPSSEGNAGTDYYRQAANQGIKTLISALQRAGLAFNYIDIAVLLMNHRALEELETKLNTIAPGSDEAKGFSLFVDQFRVTSNNRGQPQEAMIDMKRLKEVFGGLGGRMHTFGTGDFGKILNSYAPDVNLFEAIRGNKIIYVMLPTLGKNEDSQNFAKMLLGDFRTAVSWLYKLPEEDRPNPPFLAFLDEANSYANQAWAPVFEQARGARVIMMPAAQTIAGYREVSKALAERIIGNTWTKLFFKIGTQESAVEAADLIGMEMKTKRSISTSTSKSTMADSLRTDPESKASQAINISESIQQTEDYKVSPDGLKGLSKGECIVTYGGDSLYDLRIPMIKFTKEFRKEVGPARINRFRKKHVTGADFFKNAEKYLSKAA